jgi:anti-sigma factor RsiW
MNCQEMTNVLHGYIDRELDPMRSLEAEQHLKDCPACQLAYKEQQTLRKVIAGHASYFEAPDVLYENVRSAVREAGGVRAALERRSWDWSWLWPRALASVAVAGLTLLLVLPWLGQPSAQSRLAQEIVSAHVRSLMMNHLTDVASSDQHTVKPWFNGKVPFSPPVVDPAAEGFPLVGGRLDVVEAQPVAALVYQRRKHSINLFIWPSGPNARAKEEMLTLRGYNVAHWIKDGMDCWAVSDVNRGDLEEFARLAGALGQGRPAGTNQ